MKKIIAGLMVLVFALTLTHAPAWAKTLSEVEKEKNNINRDIKDTQNQLSNTQAEMAKVQSEILELDTQLNNMAEELETLGNSLVEAEQQLVDAEWALEQAQKDRDEQFEAFKERLRAMHEYGSASFLEVLFQATSIRDFLTRLEYMNDFARSDQQLAERMQEAEQNVSDRVEETARHKETIEALHYMQTVKMEELQVVLDNRLLYFEKLDADEERYQAKLEQEKETEKIIQAAYQKLKAEEEARIRAAQAAQAKVTYNGVMLWPAPSYKYISDTYRNRINPVNKKAEMHTGVDIASALGNNILAADSGEVILASYNGGYGNCVIINHGGGISTLYGHASKLLVSVGQQVKKGDVIAKIGSTGLSTGPHLHFEVRVNGKATDPKPYLGY